MWGIVGSLVTNFIGANLGWILGAVGTAGGLLMAYLSGKKGQAMKDENNTLKETINASKARTDVETKLNATPDSERDGMLHGWDRDK